MHEHVRVMSGHSALNPTHGGVGGGVRHGSPYLIQQFSRFISQQSGQAQDGLLAQTTALLLESVQLGDSCLNLAEWGARPWPFSLAEGDTPPTVGWQKQLLASACVGVPGDREPLIMDGTRLYLYRHWRDEQDIAQAIQTRLHGVADNDFQRLRESLDSMFPSSHSKIDWQKLSVALAATHRFVVISGGPGTGKTTSLINLLALILAKGDLQISLAAPTGKAAARMMASIRQAKGELKIPEDVRDRIPTEASTIHRLLGYSSRGWRHDADNPLLLDCLVVDEASMVSLSLMARLVRALPPACRLILLGDRDQLASVEAGSVLGDITGHGYPITYDSTTVQNLAPLMGDTVAQLPSSDHNPKICNAIALLRTSYRFDAKSGIGQLARLVNDGDGEGALALLSSQSMADLHWQREGMDLLLDQVVDGYANYLQQPDVASALEAFARMRVLCAGREGPCGVEGINRAVANRLQRNGLLEAGTLVHGMPVMITANHYELGLFNGDVGLVWRDGNASGRLHAWFYQSDQSLYHVPVQMLPGYQQAWAMTVHKSQGSEFDRVVLVLPQVIGARTGERTEERTVQTRELLYTAITRARHHFDLYADQETFCQAVGRQVRRSSGLATALGWPE
ncbi:MAG: exodeoxyribonuclease V subunit alpha [Mariprofundales bacterium]